MTNSNEPMNDEELERDLENFLVGDSPLSELYAEQSNEQTPPELDRLIITAAQKKPRPAKNTKQSPAAKATKPKRSPRWIKPIAAAATIVLGLALTLDLLQDQAVVQESGEAGLTNQRTNNSPALEETTTEKIEIRKEKSSFADRSAPTGNAQTSGSQNSSASVSDAPESNAPESNARARSAPAKASAKASAKAAQSAPKPEAIAPSASTNIVDDEPEPEAAPERDTAEPLVPAEPVAPAKPKPQQESKRSAPQIETPVAQPAREPKTQPAPQPRPQPAPARKATPQQPPTPSEQTTGEPIAPSANQKQVSPPPAPANRNDQDLILPDNPPRATGPRPDAADTPQLSKPAQPAATQQEPEYRASQQSWIRHIVFLADTGQSAQAVAELRLFRSKNPQAPIPAELDGLGAR